MNARAADQEVIGYREEVVHVRGECAELCQIVDTLAAHVRYAKNFLRLSPFGAPGGSSEPRLGAPEDPLSMGANVVTTPIVEDRRRTNEVTAGLSNVGVLSVVLGWLASPRDAYGFRGIHARSEVLQGARWSWYMRSTLLTHGVRVVSFLRVFIINLHRVFYLSCCVASV